jgi:hypothetical protein
MHSSVSLIDAMDIDSADNLEKLSVLSTILTAGQGTIEHEGKKINFSGIDYAHKTTDQELTILYRPLIDVTKRMQDTGENKALDMLFNEIILKLRERYANWHSANEFTTKTVAHLKIDFYHYLTTLVLCALANDRNISEEVLGLGADGKALLDLQRERVFASQPYKNALASVTGFLGELRQVKAYIKKKPYIRLALGVSNEESNLKEKFLDENWIFLNDSGHNLTLGRCLTVNFNGFGLQQIADIFGESFDSIVADRSVVKFSKWNRWHLRKFNQMLKPRGTFVFLPEGPGNYLVESDENIFPEVKNEFCNCRSLNELFKLIEDRNVKEGKIFPIFYIPEVPEVSEFKLSLADKAAKFKNFLKFGQVGRGTPDLNFSKPFLMYAVGGINAPILARMIKEKSPVIQDLIKDDPILSNLNRIDINLKSPLQGIALELAMRIDNIFFKEKILPGNLRTLREVFSSVAVIENAPYPIKINENGKLYIQCQKSAVVTE